MSSYSEGSIHQLADSLEAAGWTAGHVTMFKQSPAHLAGMRQVLDGEAEIRPIQKATPTQPPRITRTIKSGVKLVATTGREAELAKEVFNSYVDPAFTVGPDESTDEVVLNVEEMTTDGKFVAIFGGLGTAGEREFTPSQVTVFCRDHPSLLRKGGFATFFRLKGGRVADVRFGGSGRLSVLVFDFGYGHDWSAECQRRVVVPQ